MGRAAAVQLAGKGANVVVVARTLSKLQSTVEELKVRTVLLFFTFNLLTHNPGQVSQLEEATLLLHQC
jgi:short-subunit dehydrogenase